MDTNEDVCIKSMWDSDTNKDEKLVVPEQSLPVLSLGVCSDGTWQHRHTEAVPSDTRPVAVPGMTRPGVAAPGGGDKPGVDQWMEKGGTALETNTHQYASDQNKDQLEQDLETEKVGGSVRCDDTGLQDCTVCVQLIQVFYAFIKKLHSTKHSCDNPYTCYICDKGFSNSDILQMHIMTHLEDRLHGGNTGCPATQGNKLAVNPIEKCHHSAMSTATMETAIPIKQEVDWDDADSTTGNEVDEDASVGSPLHQHPHEKVLADDLQIENASAVYQTTTSIFGPKGTACDVCYKIFPNRYKLKCHKMTHTGEKPFKCDICLKEFRANHSLRAHILIHFGEKPHPCHFCGKDFRTPQLLKRHQGNKHPSELVSSTVSTGSDPQYVSLTLSQDTVSTACGDSVINEASGSSLQHIPANVRNNDKKAAYNCDFCERTFVSRYKLEHHRWTHTGEKPYQCDICQNKFSTNYNLKEHRLIHSGEKPHECDICRKKFRLPGHLKKHLATHSDEKEFQCSICAREFALRVNLARHMMIHTGAKPHKCELCGRDFREKQTLGEHMRTHTGEQAFQCDICGNRYRYPASLRQHKKTHVNITDHLPPKSTDDEKEEN